MKNNNNRCLFCGTVIPEGMQICTDCLHVDWDAEERRLDALEHRRKTIRTVAAYIIAVTAVTALLLLGRTVFAADLPVQPMPPDEPNKPCETLQETPQDDEMPEVTLYRITAYCPCELCCGDSADGVTATGTIATEGRTVAVDPDVIPLGSTVTIDGHEYIAEDVGGAIKGDRIDVFFDRHEDALQHGVVYAEVAVGD